MLAPAPALGQALAPATGDQAQAARSRRIAEQFEAQARILTVFDRQGNVVTTVGERALYTQPVFSPDGKRLAVTKRDLEEGTAALWVLDVATGNSARITSMEPIVDEARSPVWSPDGSRVAYVARRGGSEGLYRKSSNGEGTEELLYQHPGAGMNLSDWSMDGRFLSFSLGGSVLYALPLGGVGERKPIEVLRSASEALHGPQLSPDSRFLSYSSGPWGKAEVYVRPFDPSAAPTTTPAAGPWRVSDQGSLGAADGVAGQGAAASWRRDGKEMYYVAADHGVMAVEVGTGPALTFGKPTLLFYLSEAVPVNPGLLSISRDGERVVIAVPHAPTLQQIAVFDRQGRVLRTVGEPGRYRDAALSPDGTRVATVRIAPRTDNVDIWTFDVASGRATRVTDGAAGYQAPVWSPDGRQVAYVARGVMLRSTYRKAWDGSGPQEQLFQYTVPTVFTGLTDWSVDGKFLTFNTGGGPFLLVVPLSGDQKGLERKAIEWLREEYDATSGRLSPDSRFMAYLSNEIEVGIFEVYVRPFDASQPEAGAGGARPVRVSTAGARGRIAWRRDGKELYYLSPSREVMAVDVTTTPTFHAGTPRRLFTLPDTMVGSSDISGDGERFLSIITVPASVSAR
jgi:Tol biopolymer transport system component